MSATIMVIDDEPAIGQLLHYQLSGAGYTVEVYQQAHRALVQIAHAPPDLVLLDVMMPEMSGYDLCRDIRAFSQVPIIMLTAKHADTDMVAGLHVGADDYVAKPFTAAHLIARIEALLRRVNRTSAPKPRPQMQPQPALALTSVVVPPVSPQPARLGRQFSSARSDRGLSLHDASIACGVRWEFLQAIEQEQFRYIPRNKLGVALRTYSALLNIDLRPYQRHPNAPSRSLQSMLLLLVTLALLIILTLIIFV